MADQQTVRIIKKKVKGHGGHHGGSWKVAYADFVTAMMAFFLLMWLMGNATEGQRRAISDYFENPSAVAGAGGASNSMINHGGTADLTVGKDTDVIGGSKDDNKAESEKTAAEAREDKVRLESLLEVLKEAVDKSQALKPFKDQLLLDITDEGLRIQIVDKENRPMFDSGSAVLKNYTEEILHEIGKIISSVPNKISISGHTDATPYRFNKDYDNWELSADRANAARRELVAGGMNGKKMGRVVGLASSVLFDKNNPYNPINRRVSIIVLNKATEKSIVRGESVNLDIGK